jgi:V/A-type H+-transporting ATPase subunit E
MQDKLQELTDKIYLEGVTRGNREAEAIISEARTESEKIRKEAEKTAGEIVANARKEADEIREYLLDIRSTRLSRRSNILFPVK